MDAATMAAAGLTRLFEFPRQSTATLAWRARQQAIAAATSSPLTRGPKRHALAESLVGLGLGVEARTLLQVTMKDDPIEAASPTTIGLAAIAALLADRPGEAGDLARTSHGPTLQLTEKTRVTPETPLKRSHVI
jgi:hypothetical protein